MVRLRPTLGNMRNHLIVGAIDSVLVIKGPSQADDGSFGSSSEELNASKSSPHYPNDQTLFGRCGKFRKTGHKRHSPSDELTEKIDNWRSEQRPIPSRPEAIRQLVELALKAKVHQQ
jgi:hypothetical protein